jgi:DNA-directed RNA polymerase specialized sigma subunit
MNLVDREDLKDISSFIRSISPSTVEKICDSLKLTGLDREVWLLRYRDKHTIEEVAAELHTSVATINRIIQKLKIMIALELSLISS